MESILTGMFTALYFGIMTSVSPCPLATNIAAISFIGNKAGDRKSLIGAGLLYTAGRMAAYLIISVIIVTSLTTIPETARFLQKYMNIIIGPFLIIAGLFLLDIIKVNKSGSGLFTRKAQEKAQKGSVWTAALLGFVFALTFCPVSAGLFFSNIMNSVKNDSQVILPLIYGTGTAIPVLIFAFILGFGANSLGRAFDVISKIEWWARKITGVVFIGIGAWLTYNYILS